MRGRLHKMAAPRVLRGDSFSHIFFELNVRPGAACPPLPVSAIVYTDGAVGVEALRRAVLERLVRKVHRFRSVLERGPDGWVQFREVEERALDWSYHVREVDGTSDAAEWRRLLSEWCSEGWDADKPWWRFRVVRATPGGRPTVLFFTDHAVGDGVSFVSAMRELLCDGFQRQPMSRGLPAGAARRAPAAEPSLLTRALAHVWGAVLPHVEVMLPADRPNTFKIKSPPREFLYATTPAPMALAKFLAVKDRVSGATVNDVMMAVISLALKRWCAATHDPLLATGNDLRGSFLVNMRSAERDGAPPPSVDSFFGNDFVLVSTVYPMHERTRFDTVLASRNATRTLKSTWEFAMRKVVRDYVVPLAPKGLLTHIALALNTKYSITTSNVFLSHEELSLCGRAVTQIDFATFPPFGLYIGIATYKRQVSFNIVAAKSINVDPEQIVPLFAQELDALLAETAAMSDDDIAAADKRLTRSQDCRPAVAAIVIGAVAALLLGLLYR